MSIFRNAFAHDDLSVVISELLVATADSADALVDDSVPEVLKALRERLGMDAVFVSEFLDGQHVLRFVEKASEELPLQAGSMCDLEATYCKRVLDGRLAPLVPDMSRLPAGTDLPPTPVPIGSHLTAPVMLNDGTLCCLSRAPNPSLRERDLVDLQRCAQLVARRIDTAKRPVAAPMGWIETSIEPMPR
jgi:GAF domain-containing protein